MRIAAYNIEWFDSLFDDAGQLVVDGSWSARYDVTKAMQTEALGIVFTALNVDVVMIIEAPDTNRQRDTVRSLEGFAKAFDLRARKAVMGFSNDTQQEIAALYDPDVVLVQHDPKGQAPVPGAPQVGGAPRFDGTFRIDLDIDATEDKVAFSKPPLEVAMTVRSTGQTVRLIGAHLKSKAPHGATNRDEVMRLSIANRRKQLAQAIWLRTRIEEHLVAGDPMIVMGDLNDGPGLDEYEHLFGRSSVEIILGTAIARCSIRMPRRRCYGGSGRNPPRHGSISRRTNGICRHFWITSWCRRIYGPRRADGGSGIRSTIRRAGRHRNCARPC